jgi:integrase/recombinase XerD
MNIIKAAQKVLPVERWPASDQAAWKAAFIEGELFEPSGAAAHWAAGSRTSVAKGYGRWIGYLANACPEILMVPPAERITESRIDTFVEELRQTVSSTTVYNAVKHTYDAVRVMSPGDWKWLQMRVTRLSRLIRTRPKADRLVSSRRLLELGLELMDTALAVPTPHAARLRYRDGLLIALLASRALRRRNITNIRVGRNLNPAGDGYQLLFGPDETKMHERIDTFVPLQLVPYLNHYLEVVRPSFVRASQHDGLWASAKGGPMGDDAIYKCVRERTRAAFGKPINLHLFRDCSATTIAIEDPANILVARDLLGHSDLRMTQRYNQADQIQAAGEFQAALAVLDKELNQRRRTR